MSRSSELIERLEPMWEMADLDYRDTGISSVIIYVSVKQHSSGPRIKVGKNSGSMRSHTHSFSVSISDNPKIIAGSIKNITDQRTLKFIYEWVIKNKEVLMDYWNKVILTRDLFNRIQPISM